MGRAWLRTVAASPEVELVGVVDLDLAGAASALEECELSGIEVSNSLADFTNVAEAVINVTVPEAHLPVNVEALRLGLPVLCEKPAAPTVAEAMVMAGAAESSGQLLMISQSRRYFRQVNELKSLLDQIGRPGIITCDFFKAPHFGGFREEMAQPLLVDMAIHQFDLARLLTEAEPISVYCESHNPSWSWFDGDAAAHAIFEFKGGIRFVFNGSWVSGGRETSWNGDWRISTADGIAHWDGDTRPTGIRNDQSALPIVPDEDSAEGIAGSLAEFVHAVRAGQIPTGEIHSNIWSLAMVEAAVTSAATRAPVKIADIIQAART